MINPMDLSGRTILVTGASSGIGRATCVLLSQLGAKLILVARDEKRLEQTKSLLDGNDHRVEPIDLADVDSIPRWLKVVGKEDGPLDGLVHSAGVQVTRPLQFLSSKNIHDVMQVNFTAAVILAKGFRQRGVSAPSSSIALISSVMGLVGQPAVAAYAASKGALIALTKSLALELAGEGIRVNCVAPGQVRTEMTQMMAQSLTEEQYAAIEAHHPLGIGEPMDVANAVAFLLADTGRWITGSTLVVDGGYTAH